MNVLRFLPSWREPKQLIFNNILLMICSLGLAAFSIYLAVLLHSGAGNGESLYANWLGLAVLGILLAVMCAVGIYGAKQISLNLILIYFWSSVVAVAPLVIFSVASFNLISYLKLWISHHWVDNQFKTIRRIFCDPGTADTTCKCPLIYSECDTYCLSKFNQTDCQQIRDEAEQTATAWTSTLLTTQGVVGIVNILELGYGMFLCVCILTKSVVMATMNDIINYLLLIPVGGSMAMGIYLWKHKQYSVEYVWVPTYFVAIAAGQVLLIPLGIAAGRSKRRALLLFYEVLTGLVILSQVAVSVACYWYSLSNKIFDPNTSAANIEFVACQEQLPGCCCCNTYSVYNSTTSQCPEWSKHDIEDYLALELQLTGLIAVLSALYVVGGLVTADVLRVNLKDYKCDYV